MWITVDPCKHGTGYSSVCFFRLSAAVFHWKQKFFSTTELLWELLSQRFTSIVLRKDKASEKKDMWLKKQLFLVLLDEHLITSERQAYLHI